MTGHREDSCRRSTCTYRTNWRRPSATPRYRFRRSARRPSPRQFDSSVDEHERTVAALHDPNFDPATVPQIASRIGNLMTPRLNEAIRLAQMASTAADRIETKHLLIGLLDEADNLGARVLETLDADSNELRDAAAQIDTDEPGPVAALEIGGGFGSDGFRWSNLSLPARLAFASTLEASINLGHNYLGCEHLLLGLLDITDGGAARVLQGFGVTKDERVSRRNGEHFRFCSRSGDDGPS